MLIPKIHYFGNQLNDHYFLRRNAMLILTRHLGETIVIGDDVHITILGIKGGQIRLGIDAPKDLSVHRLEVYQRIQDQKRLTLEIDSE